MQVENILLQVGIYDEIVNIVKHLDTESYPTTLPGDVYSVGNALVLFLECLHEPVVPYAYQASFLEVCDNGDACKRMVHTLPREHFNVFRYICAFLRELLKHRQHNRHNAHTLATTFGGVLIRSKRTKKGGKTNHLRERIEKELKTKFVSHFLVRHFQW